MIRASCLCGGVRFEIRGELFRASHCHCSMCRKAHGAAFGSYAQVRKPDLQVVQGEALIAAYESSPGIRRTFCVRCGSTLQWINTARPDTEDIALGILDDDPEVRPACHIHVASKAPWYDIGDALPQHPAGQP
jgi:hypothetical protein